MQVFCNTRSDFHMEKTTKGLYLLGIFMLLKEQKRFPKEI